MITEAEKKELVALRERREAISRAIDKTLKFKSGDPARWRAAVALYLNMNPIGEEGLSAREEYRRAVLDARDMRVEASNAYGTNESDTMRFGINAPAWFMTQIESFDRMAFDASNPQAKENTRKLFKEFAELRISEKI